MGVIRVLDVSEFTREIDPSWWISARDVQDVRAAVIQAWGGGYIAGRKNVHLKQQLAGAQAGGLGVARDFAFELLGEPHELSATFATVHRTGQRGQHDQIVDGTKFADHASERPVGSTSIGVIAGKHGGHGRGWTKPGGADDPKDRATRRHEQRPTWASRRKAKQPHEQTRAWRSHRRLTARRGGTNAVDGRALLIPTLSNRTVIEP